MMGEVIEFRRPKPLKGFIPQPSLNQAEPITADKFPAWNADTAPSEYCAPERDPA
jgi:hypothetical protein